MSVAVQARGPRLAGAWEVLLDTLLHERANLAGRVRVAIQAAYRFMPADMLDGEVAIQVEWMLSSIRDGCEDISDLAAVGEVRAQQGVPVAEMLRAWRIGIAVLIGYAREVGEEEHRTTFVRGVLLGSLPSTELRMQAEAYGLDPSRGCS